MDEDTIIPLPEDGQPEKKKRGRKPKLQAETPAAADAEGKPARKRGRPKKIKPEDAAPSGDAGAPPPIPSGPQWRDMPPSDIEHYSPENEIFTGSDGGDDFAYSKSGRADFRGDDGEIPQYFSTSDEDLDPDSYRNRPEREAAIGGEPAAGPAQETPDEILPLSDPSYESFAEAEAARQDRRNNRRNWKQNNRDNPRSAGQNPRQQNQNQKFQQNRSGGQNRQQPNQNRQQPNQQRFQQGGGQNPRQQNQNRQPQQQKKKPAWKQADADSEAMNPGDLPDWEVLKSEAGISRWLEGVFEGKSASDSGMGTGARAETGESPEAAAPETAKIDESAEAPIPPAPEQEAAEDTPAQAPVPPEEMSYWQLLSSSTDSRIERPAKPEAGEAEPAPEHGNPPRETASGANLAAVSENPKTAPEFSEETSFLLPDGSAIGFATGYEELCPLHIKDLRAKYAELSIPFKGGASKGEILAEFFRAAREEKKLVRVCGVLDVFDDGLGGAITFASDSYALKSSSVYVPKFFIEKYGLKRGHAVCALAAAPREGERENCPFAVKITSVMGGAPEAARDIVPFSDLTPYYPTRRIILESAVHNSKDNLSMRAVDLLTPIGFGQRALIVAPPRTGKTMLMQGMAKSIRANNPGAKLIILLVDERPEEVTDFRRAIDAEVVASTFDQDAASHIHAAEMVISKARRMVECGEDVVILLDSITRLARAYNAMMPNGGRTMSGGVEANALQKPKKFFGSARNIEGGGSLTIIGTALIETGSKMDEVIFEEFKGTGNLELDLDRSLSDKRIFPAINIEKSGTRKEELLYHPDELTKIYALRRAMKGIPAADSMEMLIQRLKKVKTNVEFLLGLNR